MEVVRTVAALREARARRGRLAFVPTMGNLHVGHLALVRQAHDHAPSVAASLFVNRLQFGPSEDFDRYPRTEDADLAGLEAAGCDLVFAPSEAELYPEPQNVFVTPPPVGDTLEGARRPGHFQGVTTVVLKLFLLVQPQVALFGKKDYQQLRVIEAMARQLAVPVEIVAGETVRAPDGLALSSRNGYLSPGERAEAPRLRAVLLRVADGLRAGNDPAALEAEAVATLSAHGWQPDYVAVRDRATLADPTLDRPRVVLGAARLGATRLIDNVEV